MTDGGLDEAIERTRAARVAAEREAEERRRAAEQKRLDAERQREEARDRVRAAGQSFAKRAKAAGIPFDEVQVHTGWRETGVFKKKRKPVYSARRNRWVTEASYYSGGGGSWDSGHTVRVPIEVLEDGTVLVNGVEYTPPEEGKYSPIGTDDVIAAMSNYLVDKLG
jgi:hypothetical protein